MRGRIEGRTKLQLALTAMAMAWVGCAPATRLIVSRGPTEEVKGTPQQATLVVGNIMNWAVVNLLDERGKLVGQLTGRSHTVLHLPPGALRLYAIPERQGAWGDRIEGSVEAGRVYYAQVGMRYGGLSFKPLAARLDPEEWNNRATYVHDLARVSLEQGRIPEVEQDLGDPAPLLQSVDALMKDWEPQDKQARVLRPDDGERS